MKQEYQSLHSYVCLFPSPTVDWDVGVNQIGYWSSDALFMFLRGTRLDSLSGYYLYWWRILQIDKITKHVSSEAGSKSAG
jgi:hypothetical protein